VIFRLIKARGNEIRLQPTPLAAKPSDRPPGDARTRRFSSIKAHLCRRRPSHLTRSPVHAGAGGARSRAISIRMSLNIRSDTAAATEAFARRIAALKARRTCANSLP
jgi:hypothetical protein